MNVQLDSAFAAEQPDAEGSVTLQQLPAVIEFVAAVEHGQRAVAEKLMQAAMPGALLLDQELG